MGVSRALARVLPSANLPLQALYGRRLRWGRAARKRGFAGETPALPGSNLPLSPSTRNKRIFVLKNVS